MGQDTSTKGGQKKESQGGKGHSDKQPQPSGKPGGNLQGGSGGSQNKPKKGKSGGGKA